MDNNEQTQILSMKHSATTMENTKDKKHKGKDIALSAAKMAAAAAGGAVLSSFAQKGVDSNTPQDIAPESPVPEWSDGNIAVATGDYEDLSFSAAFAAARQEVGPGGAFEWHGKVYGTYLKNEWDNMSAQEKAEYHSHFSWSNHTATSHNDTTHQDDSSEVEVIGVSHSDDVQAHSASLSVDGDEAILVEVDSPINIYAENGELSADMYSNDLSGHPEPLSELHSNHPDAYMASDNLDTDILGSDNTDFTDSLS